MSGYEKVNDSEGLNCDGGSNCDGPTIYSSATGGRYCGDHYREYQRELAKKLKKHS